MFGLLIYAFLGTWPNLNSIAFLSGTDPSLLLPKGGEGGLDPSLVTYCLGVTSVLITAAVAVKVKLVQRKMAGPPVKEGMAFARGGIPVYTCPLQFPGELPPVRKAPLVMTMGRMLLTCALIVGLVMVPEIIVQNVDPSSSSSCSSSSSVLSSLASFALGYSVLFKYGVIVLVIVPVSIFVSDAKLRSFANKKMRLE